MEYCDENIQMEANLRVYQDKNKPKMAIYEYCPDYGRYQYRYSGNIAVMLIVLDIIVGFALITLAGALIELAFYTFLVVIAVCTLCGVFKHYVYDLTEKIVNKIYQKKRQESMRILRMSIKQLSTRYKNENTEELLEKMRVLYKMMKNDTHCITLNDFFVEELNSMFASMKRAKQHWNTVSARYADHLERIIDYAITEQKKAA